MSDTFASILADPRASLLVGIALRSLIVLALGFAALLFMGRRASASARSLVMLVCMLSLLGLPVLSLVVPGWHVPLPRLPIRPSLRQNAVEIKEFMPVRSVPQAHPRPIAASGVKPHNAQDAVTIRKPSSQATAPASAMGTAAPVSSYLLLIWLSGTGLYLGWLLLGLVRLWRLARRCPVVLEGELVTLIGNLAAECGVRSRIAVRQAVGEDTGLVTPMTWGWLRPVLLMPAGVMEEWPRERLRAVLLHEAAHIARQDWLAQALTQLSCGLYWFNPLVWRMAQRMERETEQACDDRVLISGMPASDYATHLLEVVRALRTLSGTVLYSGAQTMAAPRSNIQARLVAILASDRNRSQATPRAKLAALAVTALVLTPLAALRPASADNAGQKPARHLQESSAMQKKEPVSAESLDDMATEKSWRGDWAEAAKFADEILQDKRANDDERASAYWIKFESAWWLGDKAESDRNYRRFVGLARKHPGDKTMQINWETAKRYRASPDPGKFSNEETLVDVKELIQGEAYADGLHLARYLLNRANVPGEIRAEVMIYAYLGAHYWGYEDTEAQLQNWFKAEVAKLPEDVRGRFEDQMAVARSNAKTVASAGRGNPVSGMVWEDVKLDSPANLDFSQGSAHWELSSQEGAGADYAIGDDPQGHRPGAAAGYLAARVANPHGDGALRQTCRADMLRGKRIRYSGYVRTEGVEKGADFFLHLDAPDRVRTWNMLDRPIRGTTGWTRYEYVVNVADNNQGLIFGIALEGKGKVWLSDVKFEEVGKDVPVTPPSNNFEIKDGEVTQK